MGKKANHVFDELWDGYQVLARVLIPDNDEPLDPSMIHYLDGYADAMAHADHALAGEGSTKHLFELLGSKKLRKAARKELKRQRRDRGNED